jgi:hypothetical protein
MTREPAAAAGAIPNRSFAMTLRPSVAALAVILALPVPSFAMVRPNQVPQGAEVRLDVRGRHGALRGALVRANPDSVRVRQRSGVVTSVAIADVEGFRYVSDSAPSPRKAALLGIGLGAAGGALLGVLAGQGTGGEGGEGGAGGGEGAEGPGRDAVQSVQATAAATATVAKASSDYRAIVGAVIGGIAGGLLGAATGMGQHELRWTDVSVGGGGRLGVIPPPAATPVFAIRIPLGRAPR